MLHLYLNQSILTDIYSYMGWNDVRQYPYVPDFIWMQICNYYSTDDIFKDSFDCFRGSEPSIMYNYREIFLYFINDMVKTVREHPVDIPPILLHDRDFIRIVNHGNIFRDASASIRADQQIILQIIKTHPWAFSYADESIRSDRNFVLTAIKHNANIFTDIIFQTDREIVLEAVQRNGHLLQYVDTSLELDREIVLTSVKNNGDALKYAPAVFLHDWEITLAALENNVEAIKFIDSSLTSNPDFMFEAIKRNPDIELGWKVLAKDPNLPLKTLKYQRWVLD